MKKITSFLLAIIMLMSVVAGIDLSAYAAYDTIGTAKSISFNTKYSGTLGLNNRQDYYKFSLSSSCKVNLTATHYSNNDAEYGIYNESGDSVWHSYHSIEYKESLGYAYGSVDVYLVAGTYYLMARNSSGDDGFGSYNFSLKYTKSNESFTETQSKTDNTIGNANTISFYNTYYGQLGSNDKADYYKFTLSSASTIIINATHYSGNDAEYGIYDEDGDYIWYSYHDISYSESQGYAKGSIKISLDKGTYYLKAYSGDESRYGFYNLRLVKPGWTKSTTNGYIFYYDSNGNKVTGMKLIGGKYYIFSFADCHMLTGLVRCNGKYYIMSKSTGEMCYGRVSCNGKQYIMSKSNGQMLYGKVRCDGYYFICSKSDGHIFKNMYVTCDGIRYYCNAYGVAYRQ